MEIATLVVLVLALFLAFRAVGMIIRIALWAVVLFAIYWLAAPYLGLPLPG